MIKQLGYKLLSKFVKRFYAGDITSKPFGNEGKVLFFEKAQHLGFLRQKQINYEQIIQDRIKKYIKKGDLVFDIGSNIGQYAIMFTGLVGEEGKVICYEPDYNNFTFLTFNKLQNKCNNIIVNNMGVGAKCERKEFFKDGETGGRTSSFAKEYVKGSQKVDSESIMITTIDEEIKKYGVPDFVKIDVEGFEFEVVKGLTKPESRTKFLIEVRHETRKPTFDYFNSRGFKCFYLDVDEIEEITKSEDIFEFANLLFLKEE